MKITATVPGASVEIEVPDGDMPAHRLVNLAVNTLRRVAPEPARPGPASAGPHIEQYLGTRRSEAWFGFGDPPMEVS